MTRLDLRFFGGFQAKLDGNDLQFPTRKSEGLLAYLAMPPGNTHAREKLAALLWSESGDDQARQSLRQTIFTLRKVLNSEDVLVSGDSDRIALNEEHVTVDAIRFQEILSTGDSARVADAVELYRGDFLEGLTINEENFENWVQIERERLREMVLSAAADLLDRQVAEGKLDSAVQSALRILGIDPLRESTHRTLMRIYLQQGRREAAIKQFQACSESLRRHLQVEPEEETTALHQEIMKASSTQARGRDERIRILMVEDNLLNRQLVTSMLDEKKYELVIAEDGGKALLELGSKRFDLILLDIKLPNVDGLTLLKVIRENQHQTPTILMTAMPGPEAEIKGLKLGATDFIRKPLQKNVLLARIQKALGRTD
ncbi:MAG TPA: BTAD domain-containing putative transcriptional regulator [Thermoanaerobaculia bacterium]|nr:BTAD domain-containing putative transcriptional regulator [Thermoanaerobaculia bacterium]